MVHDHRDVHVDSGAALPPRRGARRLLTGSGCLDRHPRFRSPALADGQLTLHTIHAANGMLASFEIENPLLAVPSTPDRKAKARAGRSTLSLDRPPCRILESMKSVYGSDVVGLLCSGPDLRAVRTYCV